MFQIFHPEFFGNSSNGQGKSEMFENLWKNVKTLVIEPFPTLPATNQSHSDIFVFPKEFGSVLC